LGGEAGLEASTCVSHLRRWPPGLKACHDREHAVLERELAGKNAVLAHDASLPAKSAFTEHQAPVAVISAISSALGSACAFIACSGAPAMSVPTMASATLIVASAACTLAMRPGILHIRAVTPTNASCHR
jgi:hypothetical protein